MEGLGSWADVRSMGRVEKRVVHWRTPAKTRVYYVDHQWSMSVLCSRPDMAIGRGIPAPRCILS